MEFVKNKASGKLFVLLDDTCGTDLLVITPEGKIRHLEQHLFEPQELVNSTQALIKQQLTKIQVDCYSEYFGK